ISSASVLRLTAESSSRQASESRDSNPIAALHGGLVRADTHHRPVRRGLGIRQRWPLATNGTEPGVYQVWVRSTVAGSLKERQVLGILNCPSEGPNGVRQPMCIIRHLHTLGNFRLRQALCVDHRFLVFHLLPLEALLAAEHVEALAVLPCGIEE